MPCSTFENDCCHIYKCHNTRVQTESGKVWIKLGHFPARKSLEKIFWSVSMKKEMNFQTLSFDMHSDNILF